MKKLALTILVLLMVGIFPVNSLAGEIEDAQQKVGWLPNDPNAYFNLGVAYFKNSKFQEAITSYKKAIQLNLNDAGVFNNLGAAYIKLGNYKLAVTSLKGAIKINSGYTDAHQNIAIAYAKLGLIDQAIASYKNVLKINSKDATALFNLEKLETKVAEQKKTIV